MDDRKMEKFTISKKVYKIFCSSVILDINNYQIDLLEQLMIFNDVKKLDDKKKYIIAFI